MANVKTGLTLSINQDSREYAGKCPLRAQGSRLSFRVRAVRPCLSFGLRPLPTICRAFGTRLSPCRLRPPPVGHRDFDADMRKRACLSRPYRKAAKGAPAGVVRFGNVPFSRTWP